MSSEEITDIVQKVLKDSLDQIQMKLTSLEYKVIFIEDQLNQVQNNNLKVVQDLKTNYSNLESQVKYIIFELNEAQMMANLVIEKTEKKILETQQIKVKQIIQFDELSKNLNIQKNLEEINTNQQQILMSSQIVNQKSQSSQDLNQYKLLNQCQYHEEEVYKTQNGTKYHNKNCNILSNYPSASLPKKKALKQGLTGCKLCKA